MKNILRNFLIGGFVFTSVVSCDNYLDVNEDPNNPSSEIVNPEIVLAATQVYTYNTLAGSVSTISPFPVLDNMNQLGNLMMNNWTRDVGASNSSYYFNEHTYNVTSDFYSGIFENLFLRTSNYTFIQKTERPGGYDNYKAIAKILKSYYFQYLVDLYGDIPYSQAHLRGDNLTPAYDDDLAIYRDLYVQLDQAIALIDNAPAGSLSPANNDVMLHGDMAMWKKFANTVKLRLLLRESQRAASASYIATKMNELQTSGAQFLGPDDNVKINPGFSATANQQNGFASTFLTTNDTFKNNWSSTGATKYTTTYLLATNDTRIGRIYSATSAGPGTYDGHVQGDVLSTATNYPVSHVGPGLLVNSAQDGIVFTAAESLLLQAEAVQRGYLAGSAQALYESAITESYKLLGLTAGDASAYYSQFVNLVGWTASANKIEAIINQKWIALNGINGGESWIENTRTGYPAHVPISPVAPASVTTRPVRLLYPSSEIAGNTANVPPQTEAQAFTSRVFWNQ